MNTENSNGNKGVRQRHDCMWELATHFSVPNRLWLYVAAYKEAGCFKARAKIAKEMGVSFSAVESAIHRMLRDGVLQYIDTKDSFGNDTRALVIKTNVQPVAPSSTTRDQKKSKANRTAKPSAKRADEPAPASQVDGLVSYFDEQVRLLDAGYARIDPVPAAGIAKLTAMLDRHGLERCREAAETLICDWPHMDKHPMLIDLVKAIDQAGGPETDQAKTTKPEPVQAPVQAPSRRELARATKSEPEVEASAPTVRPTQPTETDKVVDAFNLAMSAKYPGFVPERAPRTLLAGLAEMVSAYGVDKSVEITTYLVSTYWDRAVANSNKKLSGAPGLAFLVSQRSRIHGEMIAPPPARNEAIMKGEHKPDNTNLNRKPKEGWF